MELYNLFSLLLRSSTDEFDKLFEDRHIDICNKDGITLLMLASLNGEKKMIEMLLERGADVNLQDNNGYTALYYAYTEQLLIEYGALPIATMDQRM